MTFFANVLGELFAPLLSPASMFAPARPWAFASNACVSVCGFPVSLRALLKSASVQHTISLTRGYVQGNYAAFANRIRSSSVLEKSLVYRPVVIERHRRATMGVMTAAYHATSTLPVSVFARALCLTPGRDFEAWFGSRVRELGKR